MEQMNLKRIVGYDSSSTVIFQSSGYSDESLYINFHVHYYWRSDLLYTKYGNAKH